MIKLINLAKNYKYKQMKKITQIILIFLISYNASAQQQIPNGNFENWTGGDADSWNSLPLPTASQTSDAVQGNYAVKLTSQSIWGQFLPGLITLGEIDINNQTLSGGTPYADRPDGISFFFKYLPSGIDTMFFGAFLTKWDTLDLQTDTIGITGYLNSDTYDTYTEIELPFIYQSTDVPDTLNIIFTSSGFNGNSGSYLIIDSLSMINGAVISPTLCFPADEITGSSFKARWMTVPNATSYSLDVSANNDFSDFVSGYDNLNTGTDTFFVVNVSPGTYYYRVRVNYSEGTSINSNTIEVVVENTYVNTFKNENISIKTNLNQVKIISSGLNISEVRIYNIEGQLINTADISSNEAEFSLPVSGIYIFKIYTENKIISKKVNLIF